MCIKLLVKLHLFSTQLNKALRHNLESKNSQFLSFRNRLNKSFHESIKPDESSGLCVEGEKDDIKDKLKDLCRTDLKVQVARKYCMEEKKGK